MNIDQFISRNKKANGKSLSKRFPKIAAFVSKAKARRKR